MTTKQVRYWLPPVIYTGLIILASSLPQGVVKEYSFELSDKLLHTMHYMVYGLTLIWAFLGSRSVSEGFKKAYLQAIGVGILVGMLDEFYQSFMPSRFSSGYDVLADSVGILLAGLTFYYLMKIPVFERIRRHAKTA